jgi:streptogrisin D
LGVLALNATIDYAQGAVSGLIETNICSEAGDSGSPLYDGGILLGLLPGGSGKARPVASRSSSRSPRSSARTA